MDKQTLIAVVLALVVLMMTVYSAALFNQDGRLDRLVDQFRDHLIEHATHR